MSSSKCKFSNLSKKNRDSFNFDSLNAMICECFEARVCLTSVFGL